MIYWDHNAAAPLRDEVGQALTASLQALRHEPGNAASVHGGGRAARGRLEQARARVAKVLGVEPREVVFTGSGSEADALALKGVALGKAGARKKRLVVSAIEHPALLAAAAQLETQGFAVTRVAPEPDGRVRPDALLAHLSEDVALCALLWANNETGALQPVREVAAACRAKGIFFLTDAVQAAGKVPVTLREADADLLALSGHKLGAPPGVGVLVVRRGVDLAALTPGHQELGRRGGSANVPYAEAFAVALELAAQEQPAYAQRLTALRDGFEAQVRARIPGVHVNAGAAPRVANTSSLRFEGADGEAILIALDLAGIRASSGAACASGSLTPSHVLVAMGLSSAQAHESLRFSLGRETTQDEVSQVVEELARAVPAARR